MLIKISVDNELLSARHGLDIRGARDDGFSRRTRGFEGVHAAECENLCLSPARVKPRCSRWVIGYLRACFSMQSESTGRGVGARDEMQTQDSGNLCG